MIESIAQCKFSNIFNDNKDNNEYGKETKYNCFKTNFSHFVKGQS